MKALAQFVEVAGYVELGLCAAAVVVGAILWARGIAPVLYRLGNGLAHRKIAIFAAGDNLSSLRALVAETTLFKESNIVGITSPRDIDDAEDATVFLVFWADWAGEIEAILALKGRRCPLIVYQPYALGRIPDDAMARLDAQRHTTVANFRGRLLNDLLTSIMTTSYAKR